MILFVSLLERFKNIKDPIKSPTDSSVFKVDVFVGRRKGHNLHLKQQPKYISYTLTVKRLYLQKLNPYKG